MYRQGHEQLRTTSSHLCEIRASVAGKGAFSRARARQTTRGQTTPNHATPNHATLGQATLEYALLLAIVAVLAVGLTMTFDALTKRGITKFNAVLEKELSTGSFPESFGGWEN